MHFRNPGSQKRRVRGGHTNVYINEKKAIIDSVGSLHIHDSGVSLRISSSGCASLTKEDIVQIAKSLAVPREFHYESVSRVSGLKIR